MKNFKPVFNDHSNNLLVNKEGLFYDTKYKKYRNNNTLVGRGYNKISIKGTYFLVHRVVKLTFDPIDNPELYDVHHIDENKNNNKLDNLKYVKKGIHSSTHNKGTGNGRAVLNEEIVKYIKYTIPDKTYNETKKLVEDLYNISPTKDMVYKIKSGKTWRHI